MTRFALLLAALLAFPVAAAAPQRTIDAEAYTLAFVAESQGVTINEYVRGNETVENWTRLLTVRGYDGARSLKDAMDPWLAQVEPYRTVPADVYATRGSTLKDDVIVTTMLQDPKDGSLEIVVHRFAVLADGQVRSAVVSERVTSVEQEDVRAAWKRRVTYMEALASIDLEVHAELP